MNNSRYNILLINRLLIGLYLLLKQGIFTNIRKYYQKLVGKKRAMGETTVR